MLDIVCNILYVITIICCIALGMVSVVCSFYLIINIIKQIKKDIRG